jgi:hypothetical protein
VRLFPALFLLLTACSILTPYREAVLIVRCDKSVSTEGTSKAKLVVVVVRESLGEQVQTIGTMEVDGECRWSVEHVKKDASG